jgi:outer membrane receptor protein involved in Fe transport
LQRGGSYRAGDAAVAREEVVRFGRFVNALGNAAGNNVARTYAVWELPANSEVPNGQAGGFNLQADLWAFLPGEQSLRYRQLNSQHKNIGFPFSAPPYDPRNQFNAFRRLDKYGLRYEGRALAAWLPRLAAGFYRQKYAFAVSTIDAGSSWRLEGDPAAPVPALTGGASTFSPGVFTDGKSAVTSYGADAQATFALPRGLLLTTGLGYLRDSSKDEFSRADFTPGATVQPRALAGRAGNPDAAYRNLGWFNLFEYEPSRRLRLTAGLRVDNWATEARATPGFPLDTEAAVLSASFAELAMRPGSINVAGVRGVAELVAGRGPVTTDNTVATGNVGVVVRAPGGVNPYFRWGTSYREPGITERYALRNFGDPTFSVLLVANTELRPERGASYDAGVKIRRERWNASLGYFRNDLKDFLRPAFGDVLFVPADEARGLLPLSPFFPFHGVLYVQRTNTARARIEGVEAAYEVGLRLGRFGHLTPHGSMGWLKGSDLTPDPDALALIENFYNRADTPVPLKGSAADVPLAAITPFRGVFGLRYAARRPGWFGEYRVRHQSRIERADPLEISSTITTQYGTLASLAPLTKHSLSVGYELRRERHRLLWTLGVENLTDRFYFEHFQNAPAPGRSFVLGLTVDLFDLRR